MRFLFLSLLTLITVSMVGCGSGSSDAGPRTDTPSPVVINTVRFDPATSAEVGDDGASFTTNLYRVGDQYVDKTLIGGTSLTYEDVSWTTEQFVGLTAAVRVTNEYSVSTAGVVTKYNPRRMWLARSETGATYLLKAELFGRTDDYTLPGQTLLVVLGGAPAVGDAAHDIAFAVGLPGVVDALGVTSPGGGRNCTRIKFVGVNGNVRYQYHQPGLGLVEWTKSEIGPMGQMPAGTYNLVRPGLTSNG